MAKTLNPKQLLFLKHYLSTGNGRQSSIAAGYGEKNACKRARILLKNPLIMAEVEKHRKALHKSTGYGLEQGMAQAQEVYDFAKETGNAMAMAKAVEIRCRLSGHWIEKHQVQQVPFTVEIVRNEIPVIEIEPISIGEANGVDE